MADSLLRHRWRLLLPLIAILAVLGTASALLVASSRFDETRQRQGLVSDTLWAEQAVAFEAQRLIDALQGFARAPADLRNEDAFRRKCAVIGKRSPEVVEIFFYDEAQRVWRYPPDVGVVEPDAAVAAAAQRAVRFKRPTARDAAASDTLLVAVPIEGGGAAPGAIVARISLTRLLANTIPWWFAHEAQLTLDDERGIRRATRDENVRGRGIYVHRIATQIADRSLYLNADSTHGTPSLVPNLLASAMALLAALLAIAVWALWRDLSRRAEAESALREQHALRTAMENSLVTGLYARDLTGSITYANPAFCEMVGSPSGALLGTVPPLPFAPDEDSPQTTEDRLTSRTAALSGHPHEAILVRSDGERVHVLVHEAPLLDGGGTQIGWMASVLDVSEQKRSAEFLREQNERVHRMSRLMTMGEMASALAHELNQPLSAINSYVMAGLNTIESARGIPRVSEAAGYFERAKAQTDRAGTIIRRVRQFVGQAGPILGEVALDEVVSELLPLIRLQASGPEEQVVLRLAGGRDSVLADRVLLEQVLLNLTKNGFEAMRGTALPRREVVIFTNSDDSAPGTITLGVRDDGPGMSTDEGPVMTTSFSTTKPGGLGMGLAVCRTALELMGSRLHYGVAPGGGAEFRFALKCVAQPRSSPIGASPGNALQRQVGRGHTTRRLRTSSRTSRRHG